VAQWTAEQWGRISAGLDSVFELSGDERERWLAQLEISDPDVGRLLRELVATHEAIGASSFLDRSPLEGLDRASDLTGASTAPGSPLIGKQFGPYRVLSLLGYGGMGSVWLAERVDGLFARQVALKLVHAGLIGAEISERFAREREILASLNHPNIARLLDAGLSEDGQPYIAIEYIAGTPLTQYCDDRCLSLSERLELFGQVLRAVQYAHTHLVIHRDLKPSNILITNDGQAQLLDFGIAKLLTDGVAKETELTQLGGRALTPDYAAPEQLTGAPMTTVTDIYALGVMLYELMTGQRPYKLKRTSRAALEEAILQSEPVPPSRVAFTEAAAQARAATAKKLPRLLRGDLDTIIIKALKKSPTERYATANEFNEDIRHFLVGEVVLAQRDRVAYRAIKFARRNWIALAVAGVLFLSLAAGLAATTYEAKVASMQRDAARAAQMRSLTQTAAGRLKEADITGAQGIILEVLSNRRKQSPYTPEALNVFQEARAADAQILALTGHTDRVWAAAYSPDGRRIVTASWDNTARIWDAATGREMLRLRGHTDHVNSAAFSRDGLRIVTGSAHKTARIWDAATGRQMLLLGGHTDLVSFAEFSPDGRRVLTASSDKTARIWDAESGRELLQLSGHTDILESAAFSPDGRRVVTASDDKTARIWDAVTGRQIMLLGGHSDLVEAAAFSPDGQRVVTASDDRTVRIWDVASARQIMLLAGHADWVVSAAFSPDGQRVVTASVDRTARVWDAASGRELKQLNGHTDRVTFAAFSPDGERVVTSSVDGTARVWDASNGQQRLIGHTGRVWSAAFSPDGKRVVTASYDKTARIWDTATGRQIGLLEGHADRVISAAFSPDGKHVVTGSYDRSARIWEAQTGQELLQLSGHGDLVSTAAFSPDGHWIVTASGDKSARIWDAATGKQVSLLSGHTELVETAAFSPDGRRVVTASDDRTVRIWDAVTARQIMLLSGHTDHVISAAFSPDGRRVITASSDATARIWDAATGRELMRLDGPDRMVGAAFSPDGRRIVAALGDKTARVWDSTSGQQLMVLSGHSDLVEAAAFSPDSEQIVTASDDTTARIWDARTPALDDQVLWTEAAQFDPLPSPERFRLGLPTPADVRQWEPNPSQCDQSAGAPYDPDGRAPGAMLDRIVPEIAVGACSRETNNADARSLYQKGRALMANGQSSEARRDLEDALARGYRAARIDLGILLLQPSAAMVDVPRAVSLFEQAWTDGLTIAGFELGSLYEHGVNRTGANIEYLFAPDAARASSWYQRAAEAGDPSALAHFAEKAGETASSERAAVNKNAYLLESFKHYAAAAETARQANWPDDAWRSWRYHRASLARLLAREGMVENVAHAYDDVRKHAVRPRTMWHRIVSFDPLDD